VTRPLGVLRPEPGNTATATRIGALGYTALRLPLFAVEPTDWSAPDPAGYDALLLTSANAVRFGGKQLQLLRSLPVIAVGAATAAAARNAGFAVEMTGEADVSALDLPGRVLHLAGRDHHPVPGGDTRIVYASVTQMPDLTPLVGGVALVHSPRAARRLAELVDDRSTIAIAAISAAAATAAGAGWRAVTVADRPTDPATITAALTLAD
jgi:uroporphyrinogen-III synthase